MDGQIRKESKINSFSRTDYLLESHTDTNIPGLYLGKCLGVLPHAGMAGTGKSTRANPGK
jgi:hypothetical protein